MIISCWSVKLLKLPSVTLTHVCGTNSHNWWAKGLSGVGVVKIFCDSDSSGWKSFRLRLHSPGCWGTPRSNRNISLSTTISDTSAGSTPRRDHAMLEILVTPPGAWTASGPLFVGLASRACFAKFSLGYSGHMAEPTQLASLDSEKWFDIQGFTNFTAAHFVTRCHTVDSSQKFHLCRLQLRSYSFGHNPRFMALVMIGTKTGFKTDSFAAFETHGLWPQSDEDHAFALPIRVSISLCHLPQLVYTTPKYMNFSTCCNVLPLTCSIRWLVFLESHNSLVFLVLFGAFIPSRSHAAENQWSACWRSCWEDAKTSTRKQTVDPAAFNSGTLAALRCKGQSTLRTSQELPDANFCLFHCIR